MRNTVSKDVPSFTIHSEVQACKLGENVLSQATSTWHIVGLAGDPGQSEVTPR